MNTFKMLAVAAIVVASVAAFAQTPAKDAMKAITEARSSARSSAEYKAANDKAKAIAADAVKNIDPATIDPKDAYDYAKLYDVLGEHKTVCDLVHKYLTTNPSADDTFDAQMLMMQSCNALKEGGMLEDTLRVTTPNSVNQARMVSMYANGEFIDTIAKTKGYKDALRTLDEVQKKMIYDDPVKAATPERIEQYKKRLMAQHRDDSSYQLPSDDQLAKDVQKQVEQGNLRTQFAFVNERAQVLLDANKQGEGISTVDAFIKDHPDYKPAISARNYLGLKGSPAPELTFDREYGDFKSLADLKGKVVIVDFFAHWCGPCKASFPDVRKMYDDLHSKGLEIVGVTSYFGFYGSEQKLDKDTEYARMDGFMKEHNIDWNVIFSNQTGGAFAESYGISGIPTSILIGRDGKVIATEIGYSPESFKDWHDKVEKAVESQG